MALLILGIILFLGLHLLPTVPGLRNRLIVRLGEKGYKALFALLSVAAFVVLVWGFARAPMIPAFILLVAAYVPGQIKAKVRHPFLVAIKTWALAHLIANGDLASIFLFGSFLLYAVYDRIAVKRREETGLITVPDTGPARNDVTSLVVGLLLYVAFLLWLHPLLIGTSPL